LKGFVKRYGRKEKKRPRDRLLRDRDFAPKVLELRKRGAFLGYTYRRIRFRKESFARGRGSCCQHPWKEERVVPCKTEHSLTDGIEAIVGGNG
jgi:hypothetical protein